MWKMDEDRTVSCSGSSVRRAKAKYLKQTLHFLLIDQKAAVVVVTVLTNFVV